MRATVISDLHLGSVHCHREALRRFLANESIERMLVLNGDVCDRHASSWTDADHAITKQITAWAAEGTVVWIEGNHDRRGKPAVPDGVDYRRELELPGGVLVAHGDRFHRTLRTTRIITMLLHALYDVRTRVMGHGEHVAAYAKRWPRLYNVLCRSVRRGAVQQAAQRGCQTVICGHAHFPEDSVVNGVRFINTGAWTETPVYCAHIEDGTVSFDMVG